MTARIALYSEDKVQVFRIVCGPESKTHDVVKCTGRGRD